MIDESTWSHCVGRGDSQPHQTNWTTPRQVRSSNPRPRPHRQPSVRSPIIDCHRLQSLILHLSSITHRKHLSICTLGCTECTRRSSNPMMFTAVEIYSSVSIVVSIPACHVGDLGSIPRRSGRIGPSRTREVTLASAFCPMAIPVAIADQVCLLLAAAQPTGA